MEKNKPLGTLAEKASAFGLEGPTAAPVLPEAGRLAKALADPLQAQPQSPYFNHPLSLYPGPKGTYKRLAQARSGSALTLVTGLGVWLAGAAYLVPSDCEGLDQPQGLVALEGWQGPLVLDLLVPQGAEAFGEFLAAQGPTDLLARISKTPEEFLGSLLPHKNRFAQLWATGLEGEPAALDRGLLTLASMGAYMGAQGMPVLARGTLGLVDFSAGILDPLGLLGARISAFGALDRRSIRVKEVLTEIKHWQAYSQKQIEYSVNHNLGPYLKEELGQKACELRKVLGLAIGEVVAEGVEIHFTGGRVEYSYLGEDKKTGQLTQTLWLESSWAKHPLALPKMLEALGLEWGTLLLGFGGPVEPKKLLAGLAAKGWIVSSELEERLLASKGPLHLQVEPDWLELSGLRLTLLLGEPQSQQSLKEVLSLL